MNCAPIKSTALFENVIEIMIINFLSVFLSSYFFYFVSQSLDHHFYKLYLATQTGNLIRVQHGLNFHPFFLGCLSNKSFAQPLSHKQGGTQVNIFKLSTAGFEFRIFLLLYKLLHHG